MNRWALISQLSLLSQVGWGSPSVSSILEIYGGVGIDCSGTWTASALRIFHPTFTPENRKHPLVPGPESRAIRQLCLPFRGGFCVRTYTRPLLPLPE